ncbi:MAG: hypothetical protein LBR62_02120, partial [Puniceicoccales bacterium]|nr:hypothetical protein [Puniceicoccales bacterium]
MTSLHFVYGDDEYLVDRAGHDLLDSDGSIEVIDGQVATVAEWQKCVQRLWESVQTIDLFSNRKSVWLRRASFMETSGLALAESGRTTTELFLSLLKSFPAEVKGIISAFPVDKRSRVFKEIERASHVQHLTKTKEAVFRIMERTAKARGVQVTPDACGSIYERMNGGPRAIAHEVEKLCTYVGEGGIVDHNVVSKLTPVVPSEEFFEPVE